MNKILIVDDDDHIRELVSLFLRNEGMAVIEASNGEEALLRLAEGRTDLAVIDIMMPKMDGWELCREIKRFYDMPVLMLTAKGETSQKIKGFNLGTDDYLVKPFDPLELAARVKVLLKRYQIAESQVIKAGSLTLDQKNHDVNDGINRMNMPLKEFELLSKLASYPGKTFSRDQLIEDLWGFDYEGDERTVDVHIKRLRERFSESSYGFKITTVRGLGYRLEEKS